LPELRLLELLVLELPERLPFRLRAFLQLGELLAEALRATRRGAESR